MAKAAMIGCGKLGYPVALAWASRGHDVVGYDVAPLAKQITTSRHYPHREPGAQRLLDEGVWLPIINTIGDAVQHADIVFVAVQTPHLPEYEGITRMPEERVDFDYSALKQVVDEVAKAALEQQKHVSLVVISTCLPGTCDRELRPLFNAYTHFVYAPMFIAQGTVVEDALNPEFVLLGYDKDREDERQAIENVCKFFSATVDAPHCLMSVPSAELTKVYYNVYLGMKIVAANVGMEIAHKTNANIDDVTGALAHATGRIISKKYMNGGMGDGGGCHPRDQIALSWLAEELDLSFDLFSAMIKARESGTEWLGDLCLAEAVKASLPIVILGKAYKRGTNLTVGSPAILLKNILDEVGRFPHVEQWDPYVDAPRVFERPAVFFVGTDHDEFYSMPFPSNSIVIDPWGKMRDRENIRVVRVGRA
jgi:UDPglucose 6-dehydrogenase